MDSRVVLASAAFLGFDLTSPAATALTTHVDHRMRQVVQVRRRRH